MWTLTRPAQETDWTLRRDGAIWDTITDRHGLLTALRDADSIIWARTEGDVETIAWVIDSYENEDGLRAIVTTTDPKD